MRQVGISGTPISFSRRRTGALIGACASLFALSPAVLLPLALTPRAAHAGPKHEGDILHIFDKGRVYIITNDDAALADLLLQGCQQRERKILTPEEWRKEPADIRRFVSAVFLINRERLPDGAHVPERCGAEADELYSETTRTMYPGGPTYEVVMSAPDAAWLKQSILEFRRRAEIPRGFRKRNVRSLAVVPTSPAAGTAATPFLMSASTSISHAHLLAAGDYADAAPRLTEMDELILVDRSTPLTETMRSLTDRGRNEAAGGPATGSGDTVAWRERKPNGRSRVIISAPTADQLAEALRRNEDPLSLPETFTVLNSARDLRAVRRVAVVGVKQGPGGDELRRRLASRAATELRTLDSFEVLERSGLSEILSEIALDQAGITKAKDRARVRQMAAADALLLIEITDINGRTDYAAKHKRITPWMAAAPSCPPKPSRLKYDLGINNPSVRDAAEPILAKVVGTKSDEEYDRDVRRYNRETLPFWQRQIDSYNQERRTRQITWEQRVTATSNITISGSLRLVDLTDGLVLWETPFTASDSGESPEGVKSITTTGEDSRPGPADMPHPTSDVPDSLLDRVADTALLNGLQTMRGTALLPAGTAPAIAQSAESTGKAATAPAGRLLDIDGDMALIGLGAGDGIANGDALVICITDTIQVRAIVTHVRPRTCDARIDLDISPTLRSRLSAGQVVTRPEKAGPLGLGP